MTAAAPYLAVQHVYKRYGATVALRDVSFALAPGESVALLGANGAGKTTLLRTLATLSRPTRGDVQAFGVDAWSARTQVRQRIGIVAHQPYVYPELSGIENLRFFARMFDVADAPAAIERALKRVGLMSRASDRAGALSRGLLQRLNLARAILHEPAVLVLDEPDTGLDAAGRELLAELIAWQIGRGGSVALTSHATSLAVRCAERVAFIERGGIVWEATSGPNLVERVESAVAAGGVSEP